MVTEEMVTATKSGQLPEKKWGKSDSDQIWVTCNRPRRPRRPYGIDRKKGKKVTATKFR
jgi:hypothetical protein